MKIPIILKILLVVILPLLLFLAVLKFSAFDGSFYQKEFSKLGVEKEVSNANSLHEDVIAFLKGNGALPEDFNEREKSHLSDVKRLAKNANLLMYFLIALFVLLSAASVHVIGDNRYSINFIGNSLLYGGILSIAIYAALFFSLSLGFSDVFDSFHRLFFTQGTYTFDAANEIIVKLYPEQLFMDLGIRIFRLAILSSVFTTILGAFLIARSKKNK